MAKLKIKPEHYEVLKCAFVDLSKKKDLSHIKKQYLDVGHSELRFRWICSGISR